MLTHTRQIRPSTGHRSIRRSQHHSSSFRSPFTSSRRHVAVAVAAAASSAADLRQLLAQKERELAAMFESGRPMPQASVVAALRAEIAALDDQLNGRPVNPYVPSAPVSGGGGYSGGPRGPPSGPPPGAVRSRTEQLADKAYELVEQQMRGNQGMGQQDDADIARLEHENTQLRAEAYALLQRQQQLESMLAEVKGQKPPELLLESAEGLLARMKAKLQKS